MVKDVISSHQEVFVCCAVCGNEVEVTGHRCPFCHAQQPTCSEHIKRPLHRLVNLKMGKPVVEQALDRLAVVLLSSSQEGYKVLTLIHGYGSSGTGGGIKLAVRRQLQDFVQQGKVRTVIPGEEFEGRSARGRQLVRSYPFLAGHRDLNRANPGITVVIL
ncbi:MAG: hypothetical protein RBQ88_05700 [Desulfobulbus oligotrophicus]|nr:hypothetical protein [Desulfobulbus oligotrophicus]